MKTHSRLSIREKSVALALGFCLLSVALSRAESPAPKIEANVGYVSKDAADPYQIERAKLDLYLPSTGKDFPILVWFHGGGLTGGDKGVARALATTLTGKGIAVAAVNYRLSPKAKFPAYVEDAAAAVAWVKTHAKDLGADPARVYVGGHSAGGYLTSLLAMDPRYFKKVGLEENAIAGFLPVSGQMVTHFTVRAEHGLGEFQITADEAAPIFYLRKDIPPMLIIMGDHDWAARLEENTYFVAAARAAGSRTTTLKVVPDRDHGTIVSKMEDPNDPGLKLIEDFILSPARP